MFTEHEATVLGTLDAIRESVASLGVIAQRGLEESVADGGYVVGPAARGELASVIPPGPGRYTVRVNIQVPNGAVADEANARLLIGSRPFVRLFWCGISPALWGEFHLKLSSDPVRVEAIAASAARYATTVILSRAR